jgi:hypothetical protein
MNMPVNSRRYLGSKSAATYDGFRFSIRSVTNALLVFGVPEPTAAKVILLRIAVTN